MRGGISLIRRWPALRWEENGQCTGEAPGQPYLTDRSSADEVSMDRTKGPLWGEISGYWAALES